MIGAQNLQLTKAQLIELFDRGKVWIAADDLRVVLPREVLAGDRVACRDLLLAVARRFPESSL